jgi:hypothetical protein
MSPPGVEMLWEMTSIHECFNPSAAAAAETRLMAGNEHAVTRAYTGWRSPTGGGAQLWQDFVIRRVQTRHPKE